METFISRQIINRHTELLATGDLDDVIDSARPVYKGLEKAVDSMSPAVKSQLPEAFYFDAMLIASESMQGHIQELSELDDDQIEDYLLGRMVLTSLECETETRKRMALDA